MSTTLAQSRHFAYRALLSLWRQPWWIAVTLIQPIVWLVLFGALFKSVTQIPGFAGDDFTQFIAPGVIVMTAFFSAGWAGMGLLNDMQAGVVDRFLVTPASRSAQLIGRTAQGAVTVIVQSLIIVGLALLLGASFPGGVIGILVLLLVAVLLAVAVAALSYALALASGKEETVIAVMNFFMLPLTFLSTSFQQKQLMPDWMQTVTNLNPLNWGIEAARSATLDVPVDLSAGGGADWGEIGLRAGGLVVLALACLWVTNRAFRAYQRQV